MTAAKAIAGTIIAGATALCSSLATAATDGHVTLAEVLVAVSAALTTAGGTGGLVYGVTNRPKPNG